MIPDRGSDQSTGKSTVLGGSRYNNVPYQQIAVNNIGMVKDTDEILIL